MVKMNWTKEETLQKESAILSKEERIARARKFTLFSDTFLTVALNDIPACQHVLRILTEQKYRMKMAYIFCM